MKRLLFVIFCLAVSAAVSGANLPLMRISVENTADHTQTEAVRAFARTLQERTEGKLDIEFYHSGSYVRDSEAVRAMLMGELEMAVPGTWHISMLVPEVSLFLLPVFYGRDADSVYRLLESPIGSTLTRIVENDLFVIIPGSWMDLGHVHLFSTDAPIQRYEDLIGMPIRVAGGYGNEARIAAMGGKPAIIPWADLPARLDQGVVTGVLTSYETVRSAALWEHGIAYAFEDSQYFAQYIPMIAEHFWNSLSRELQQIITDAWEEETEKARASAAQAQSEARAILMEKGVLITVPAAAETARMREKLMESQPAIADSLGIPKNLVESVSDFFGEAADR
jgi:TRAP-type C4-dicarboxylate transport system substrate-binding protein